MIAYEGKYAPLLVQWWAELQNSGDFAKTVHSSIRDLDAFIGYFRGPAALMFEVDDIARPGYERGIWFAAAASPFFDGALWDVWIRADKRHTKSALKAIELSYTLALEKYPSLFGFTQQQELHAIHLKLGYVYAGRLLNNMDGQTQFMYQLTRYAWLDRKRLAKGIRDRKREVRELERDMKQRDSHMHLNGAA